MKTLEELVQELCNLADQLAVEHFTNNNYTFARPTIHKAEIGDKWAKIFKYDDVGGTYKQSSIHSFICMKDGFTKTLGNLKAGDIHKPASYKAPAKTARGNLFDTNYPKCITHYGPVYLR